MTACIAMVASGGKEIILVSDSKVAFGDYSADDAVVKNIPFSWPWILLFAGNDISHAKAVMDRANAKADASIENGERLSGAELAELLQEEMEIERARIIEASILSRYGFTAESFRNNGKALCSESQYNDLIYRISQVELSLCFLLCGIPRDAADKKNIQDAEIWMVSPDSPPQNFDRLGFWAIGSGANAAVSSLAHDIHYHQVGRYSDSSSVLYHVLAAKFMSESAKDVGKGTFVVLVDTENKMQFLPTKTIERVRKLWEKQGAPRVPKGVVELISKNWMILDDKE